MTPAAWQSLIPARSSSIIVDANGQSQAVNNTEAFFELTLGLTDVAEKHDGGYRDPIVFCSFGKGTEPVRIPASNRQVSVEALPEMLVTCEFFNPEVPPAPGSSLTIHKRLCAEGYDIRSAQADPITECTEPVTKVPFALADDDPATPERQQSTDEVIASGVVFDGLPAGGHTVTESPPDGVEWAIVWACEVEGVGASDDIPPLSEGFTLALDIPAGAGVVCYWFNLHEEDGPSVDDSDDASVTVLKWVCPPGFDLTSRDADPAIDCTRPLDGVGFALVPHDPGIEARKGRSGDDGPGTVTFGGVPAGAFTLDEALPERIADAFVWYCTDDPRERRSVEEPLSEGARLQVELAAGQHLWCHWYNVPAARESAEPTDDATDDLGNNTVTVRKWACPDGAGYGQSRAWYIERCDEPVDGVEFRRTTGGTVITQQTEGGVTV
jgi:hypothetical protein